MSMIDLTTWMSSQENKPENKISLDKIVLEFANISTLINNPDLFCENQKNSNGMGYRDLSLSILWGVVGSFAGESNMIRMRNANSIESYMKQAIKRLENKEDSGLFLEGTIEAWNMISKNDQEKIKTLCMQGADLIEDFPSLVDMQVVSAMEKCIVEIGNQKIVGTIPVIVKNKKGIVGIIPVFNSEDYYSASLYSNIMKKNDLLYVETINIWDIQAGKITKPVKNAIIEAEKSLLKI